MRGIAVIAVLVALFLCCIAALVCFVLEMTDYRGKWWLAIRGWFGK